MQIDRANLFPPQAELLSLGFPESAENWIICAPTGAGKTLVGEWALLKGIEGGKRGAYIAPLKAIVEEKLTDWRGRFPEIRIGLFTGETTRTARHRHPKDEQLLLFTPEKLAAYLQAWKRHLSWISELDVLVVDEFHLLGDPHRGSSLEALIGRLQRVNPFVRIVALSATLSNRDEIGAWLRARQFTTDWRPVRIARRIETFKKVAEKSDMLVEEVQATLADGGKLLVFVNSRRRSERLAVQLRGLGINADYNHAGLDRKRRTATQQDMRSGKLDVVVSTSTLEMGVNFPARKVVIFDAYGFDGESFSAMSVQRYLQCSGRAGRPGFDDHGEAVVFVPAWGTEKIDYLRAQPEPTMSGLFEKDHLLKEVLNEVATRLSISADHLEVNFARRSLWRQQGGQRGLDRELALLVKADLLKFDKEKGRYLSETALGRAAVKMSVSPQTVISLVRFYNQYPFINDFDLLLAGCFAREVTPNLGFSFEEIDLMTDLLLAIPSQILDHPTAEARSLDERLTPKSVLSAVKCAVILHEHTQGDPLPYLAEKYDCYPADLQILRDNMNWVLETAQRVFSILWKRQVTAEAQDEAEVAERRPCLHETVCLTLRTMLEYGIPHDCTGLVEIQGIGAKRAQALVKAGFRTVKDVVEAKEEEISAILRLRPPTVEKILGSARGLLLESDADEPFGIDEPMSPGPARAHPKRPGLWDSEIDPYRLRRALELRVDHVSAECVRVSGGAEPHTVTVFAGLSACKTYACDCADFAAGHQSCKHVIRARLELHDDADVLELLRQWQHPADRPMRYSLGQLWMSVCGLYDAFNERQVDYSGQKFLDRAVARQR